nr:hypothetical protein [Planctomycetota bacterium]
VQSWLRMVRDLKPVPAHILQGVSAAEAKAAAEAKPPVAEDISRPAPPSTFQVPPILKSREPAA